MKTKPDWMKESDWQALSFADRVSPAAGRYRRALNDIISHAGHPDAAEGCRIILKIAREALEE